MIFVVGCSEKKSLGLPGLDDDIINKNQITTIESRISGENKLILEKDNIMFTPGDRITIAIAINNVLPLKKDFRIILPSGDHSMLFSENSYSIIDIKDNDFEIVDEMRDPALHLEEHEIGLGNSQDFVGPVTVKIGGGYSQRAGVDRDDFEVLIKGVLSLHDGGVGRLFFLPAR